MAESGPTPAATPMMAQYRELKQRYPDFLLLFRLGDFYELFLEDAEKGARLLSITLTSRQGAPMAGIPHHAAEAYIARLVQAGQKIAICEQMEAPGKGKKLLRRDAYALLFFLLALIGAEAAILWLLAIGVAAHLLSFLLPAPGARASAPVG